jgi:hypothetical protein
VGDDVTITGRFGQTDDVWTPSRPHLGVDFGCDEGTPVFATCFGRVVELSVHDGSFGTYALVDCTTKTGDATEWYMLHAHLSRRGVDIGQKVRPGDLLGLSGATGMVTAAHLHWQMCRNDRAFPRSLALMADPFSFPVEELVAEGSGAAAGLAGEPVTLDGFFAAVCRGLDLEPTPWRIAVFRFWAGQEDHESRLFTQAFNPLATTQNGDLNTSFDIGHGPGNWNSVPVRVYRSAEAGVAATVKTLKNGFYPNILRCLADQTGYAEARGPRDFTSWVGSESYGQRVIDFMNSTDASKVPAGPAGGGAEAAVVSVTDRLTEADVRRIAREEALGVFNNLNDALQDRMRIERLAQMADMETVTRAVAALKREGIL